MKEARVSPLLHHTMLENRASSDDELQQVIRPFTHSCWKILSASNICSGMSIHSKDVVECYRTP